MTNEVKNQKKDYAASAVVDQILAMLDKGIAPWKKDWSSCNLSPQSLDGREYRGVNFFLLAFAGILGGTSYSTPIYGTFNKIKAVGGIVRKGEHGTPIVYWGMSKCKDADGNEILDEDGNPKLYFFLRRYTVFNVEQCDGIPKEILDRGAVKTFDSKPIEAAEQIVRNMKNAPKIVTSGHQPCYKPSLDEVHIPEINTFETAEGYYAALFHELAHSTAAKSRLDRKIGTRLEKEAYGREELVAEMASAMICAALGINNSIENTAAYCKGWSNAIKQMPAKAIVKAASAAQKAADYILGRSAKQSESESAE